MIFWKSGKEFRALMVSLLLWGSIIGLGTGVLSIHLSQALANPAAPFAPGERLRFQLRWTMIPAGEAIMEVLPMKTIDGVQVYHFRLTAESNAFVDMFYKVRDRIDAYANVNMTHTVRYHHKQREGDTRRNVRVEFDWQKEMALYNDGKRDKQIDILPGTFDPLSVFYFTRMLDYNKRKVIERPVSDGKKCVTGVARIIKKETITIPSGVYDTYLLEPDLKHVGGVFEKDKNAKIKLWVTADERCIPVKIASKVAIGSFVGELIAMEKGDS
ncbi:MAG: DUF3108 domain-containing protein [Desulfobacteraceae bacterium]|jgi:hypothetical protein